MEIPAIRGLPVHISEWITKSVSVPKYPHRKKRIAKKWLKRYGSISFDVPGCIIRDVDGDKQIWMHPEVFEELRDREKEDASE